MISCHYSIRKAMDVTGVSIDGREKSVYLLFMRLKGVRDCIETVNYLKGVSMSCIYAHSLVLL
jgi:hypothetical protein